MGEQQATSQEVAKQNTADQSFLIFDLIGPFVVRFTRNSSGVGTANIYAPLCPDHHANLLTDSDDIPLPGLDAPPIKPKPVPDDFVYGFKDANSPKGAPQYKLDDPHDAQKLVRVLLDKPGEPLTAFHLRFELPCPDRIAPLRSEQIWIHQNKSANPIMDPDPPLPSGIADPCMVDSKRARGLRFIYDKCPQAPEIERKGLGAKKSEPLPACDAETRGFQKVKSLGVTHYSMTVHFGAIHSTTDDQNDAYQCFRSMRGLFADLCEWRVDFEPKAPAKGFDILEHGGKLPHDCGAAVLVLQDW